MSVSGLLFRRTPFSPPVHLTFCSNIRVCVACPEQHAQHVDASRAPPLLNYFRHPSHTLPQTPTSTHPLLPRRTGGWFQTSRPAAMDTEDAPGRRAAGGDIHRDLDEDSAYCGRRGGPLCQHPPGLGVGLPGECRPAKWLPHGRLPVLHP